VTTTPTPSTCHHCRPVLPTSVCTLHYDSYLLHWRPAGFTFDEYLLWVDAVTHATNAVAYQTAGLNPDQAAEWVATGLPASTAVTWHQAALTPDQATAWLRVRNVTSVADYQRLAAAGHTPTSAEEAYGTKIGFRWPYRQASTPVGIA
jgi:hypothetical protein